MCGKHRFWTSFDCTVTTASFLKHFFIKRNAQWEDEMMKTSQAPTCLPSRTRTPPDSANVVADRSKPRPRIIYQVLQIKSLFQDCLYAFTSGCSHRTFDCQHPLPQMCNATYDLSCAESDHHNRPQHRILVKICPPHPAGKIRHM